MSDYKLKVIETKQLTPDVFAIKLDLGKANFGYRPGQHIELSFDDVRNDPEGNSRKFSIASSPTENFLMIATKIRDTPFKNKVAVLKVGDNVKISGPFGNFILKENTNRHHVMLSGGIGITPLRDIVKYATDKKLHLKITLLYSNRVAEDIAFGEDLIEFSKKNKNLQVINTITRPEESKIRWNGVTGRIDEDMIRKFVPDFREAEFYICGPPTMVDFLVEILNGMKVSEEHINVEHFTGY